MNPNEYRDYLLSSIKPFAKTASGGKEINCRCFYCPDSRSYNKGHFYIKIPYSKDEPSTYYCQKCHAKGIVTAKKLLEWDLYDANLALDITAHNKGITHGAGGLKYKSDYVYRLHNSYVTQDDLSDYKLKYINKRIGTNLTYQDCLNMKIVLNLFDLLNSNHITQQQYTRHPNIIKQLDASFIGFISYDNAFLNMRNLEINEVYQGIDKRYVNYNIFNKVDNSYRFYTIPSITNLNSPEPVRLNIAEGPFDILSVYYNLCGANNHNTVYSSIAGNGYLGLIKFFIMTKMLINMEIHIYIDNDVDRYIIDHLNQVLFPYNFPIYIHRNTYPGEKDFGVPINHIRETIERIN